MGNLSGFVLPNDVLNLYEYDSLNRLTNLTARRFLNTLSSYAYTVNPSGHREGVSPADPHVFGLTVWAVFHSLPAWPANSASNIPERSTMS